MTRNRFNQAKQQSGNPLLRSAKINNLTLNKARQLFLEQNDDIHLKHTYKIINTHPPIDEKNVANKFCGNNFLSSSNKIDILGKNITELRKGDFDKVTTKTLQLNKIQVNEELITEFIISANEVTKTLNICNKVASDTISKYNQLKLENDNNKYNQNIANIQLDYMFSTGPKEIEEVNEKTDSFIDGALIKNKKTIVEYIIAILLEGKLVDNKEQERLEMHYDFNHEDIMKELQSYFTI